jgi:hypothetical protein
VAVSNQDGVSFYSDARLAELLDIRFPHELDGARGELVTRDLIAYEQLKFRVLSIEFTCERLSIDVKRCATPKRLSNVFFSANFYAWCHRNRGHSSNTHCSLTRKFASEHSAIARAFASR